MMTEEEAKAFGRTIAEQLQSEAPIKGVAQLANSLMPELRGAAFLAWTRQVVDTPVAPPGMTLSEGQALTTSNNAYKARCQELNRLMVTYPEFVEAIKQYHAWKTSQPTDANLKESVEGVMQRINAPAIHVDAAINNAKAEIARFGGDWADRWRTAFQEGRATLQLGDAFGRYDAVWEAVKAPTP